MLSPLRAAVTLLLTPLGLDPGRAVANARPTRELREAQRAEQFAAIASRFVLPSEVAN